jgi:hypothetical protein
MMLPNYMKLNLSKGMGYSWAYLCTSTSRIIRIFKRVRRCGSHRVDWVGGRAWSSPVVPLAPPKGV